MLAWGAGAIAQDTSPVAIADTAAESRGDRSEVLVLGVAHLSQLPKGFDRRQLEPLLAKLKAWQPEAIAIEALSGAQCDYLREYDFAYSGSAADYCFDPTAAREAIGLSGAAASEAIERVLASPQRQRPPEVRRRLAALFLAAGEPNSAVVQWFRLDPTERHADAYLTPQLIEILSKRSQSLNENVSIGAFLAAELGLEKLESVDDHTGDRASGPGDDKTYAAEIAQIWDNAVVKQRIKDDEHWDRLIAKGGSIIDWFRSLNSLESQRLAVESDFAAAAASKLPGNSGRRYLAYWETRNLRMVANIREVVGPGRKVLAIVGAAHKPYYERYLGMTSDIELADIEEVLAD
ncbi:DUF5694 domain-containing protein [Erythrobacter mangrovi]|uniref:Uncharacterized protein n=1 Tax=Erythrobacter mangrovi TaxID=2739433 RepID=A0A7D3XG06_9SPHN|nr:DUF5694 domain-containing protein [Erythrobacter mangrovi]QKG70093.1 hypothetical protein HQR01_01180 [Erythrobacter mangrovi]